MQWIKVLTAASLMQTMNESDSLPSSSSVNQSYEGSDSGINTYIPQSSNALTPATEERRQPLYANAPPKPKRLGSDGICSSPSPEEVQDIYETKKMNENLYDVKMRNKLKEVYGRTGAPNTNDMALYGVQQQQQPQQQNSSPYHRSGPPADSLQNSMLAMQKQQQQHVSRRTPDIYSPTKHRQNYMDYDDVYNEENQLPLYKRPTDQSQERLVDGGPRMTQHQHPQYNYQQQQQLQMQQQQQQQRMRPSAMAIQKIPRPHSVDFLEYETKHPITPNSKVNLTNRPKSSLDINSAPDNYFYSEASYAEKMRQSVNYLQQRAKQANRYSSDASGESSQYHANK